MYRPPQTPSKIIPCDASVTASSSQTASHIDHLRRNNDAPRLTGKETFFGHVEQLEDAIILLQACQLKLLNLVAQRLTGEERSKIRSGSVFVWEQTSTGLQRWTDGLCWTTSRMWRHFQIYKEESVKENAEGSKDAFYKRIITIKTVNHEQFRVVSYYRNSDVRSGRLKSISATRCLMQLNPNLGAFMIPEELPALVLDRYIVEPPYHNSSQSNHLSGSKSLGYGKNSDTDSNLGDGPFATLSIHNISQSRNRAHSDTGVQRSVLTHSNQRFGGAQKIEIFDDSSPSHYESPHGWAKEHRKTDQNKTNQSVSSCNKFHQKKIFGNLFCEPEALVTNRSIVSTQILKSKQPKQRSQSIPEPLEVPQFRANCFSGFKNPKTPSPTNSQKVEATIGTANSQYTPKPNMAGYSEQWPNSATSSSLNGKFPSSEPFQEFSASHQGQLVRGPPLGEKKSPRSQSQIHSTLFGVTSDMRADANTHDRNLHGYEEIYVTPTENHHGDMCFNPTGVDNGKIESSPVRFSHNSSQSSSKQEMDYSDVVSPLDSMMVSGHSNTVTQKSFVDLKGGNLPALPAAVLRRHSHSSIDGDFIRALDVYAFRHAKK